MKLKLSERVSLIASPSGNGQRAVVGIRARLSLLTKWTTPKAGEEDVALHNGTLSEAPELAVVHFQAGGIAIKISDNWVFEFANTYSNLRNEIFIGFRRYPDKVDCVWW